MIVDEFPDLLDEIRSDRGLFHMQMGALTRLTQKAIDCGDKAAFKRICELFRKMFLNASDSVKNALYVSFLEHLNFKDSKKHDRQWAYLEMPKIMQQAYEDIMNYLKELFKD